MDAYIYDAVRTPRGRGRADGGLNIFSPSALAGTVLAALASRSGVEPEQIDDVVLGCVESVDDQGGNIARMAAFQAGFGHCVPGVQLNRFCGSGLEAINIAAAKVACGQDRLVLAGGVEMMSLVPIFAEGGPFAADPHVNILSGAVPQGISADLIATRDGWRREDVDRFAMESQRRAGTAISEGRFDRSLLVLETPEGTVARDEHPRPTTTLESLAALKPAFAGMGLKGGYDAVALSRYPEIEAIEHVHHAGNSSGIVDGAAALLIGSAIAGAAIAARPRARFRAFAAVGSEPTIMLTGTVAASQAALRRAGMTMADIDLVECNEAFAAVVLHFMSRMGADPARVNVNGGAIALGHPLGASGAILVGTALDEMERTGAGTALITLCVGVGMGVATIVERI